MQTGTAIVATPVGDLPRLYEKYSFGILAEAASSDAFARAICAALDRSAASFQTALAAAAADFDMAELTQGFLSDIRQSGS